MRPEMVWVRVTGAPGPAFSSAQLLPAGSPTPRFGVPGWQRLESFPDAIQPGMAVLAFELVVQPAKVPFVTKFAAGSATPTAIKTAKRLSFCFIAIF